MKIKSFLDSYDINAIPQESKNRQYKDYKPILDFLNNVCESRIYENQSSITKQGISVESTRNIIDNIKDHFELEAFQFRAYCPYNACIVEHSKIPYHYQTSCSILTPVIATNIDIVTNEMENGGYNKIKEKIFTDSDGRKWVIMIFDPVKQDSVTDQIKKAYPYIYYTTEAKNKENIETAGLKPQSTTNLDFNNNEPRLYLYYGSPNAESYINMMKNIANDRKMNDDTFDGTYAQFTIDTDILPDDAEFFDDPRGNNYIYTQSIIPPSAIIQTKIVKF